VRQWTPDEAKDYLCWCLEGKASDFYATVVARDRNIGILELLHKLEKRFGGAQLPDTAQVELANSKQRPNESIEEWADRVLLLAVRAFPDLPEEYMYRQAVKKICHGCIDRDAGQYVVNLNLGSVEMTIDRIKSYQFNHQSIFDRGRKEVREVVASPDNNESSDEDMTNTNKVCQTSQKVKKKDQLYELTKQMGDLQSTMRSLLMQFEKLHTPTQRSSSRSPVRSRSASPDSKCYTCGGKGHFMRDCPRNNPDNKQALTKQVTFSDLNEKGSGNRA
jgi:hypothetical protein